MIRLGVDTGGTFTDFVYFENDRFHVHKTLSTRENPASAVREGIHHIGPTTTFDIIHGSTVATNTIIEKNGAKTVLITNEGFEDIIAIGRQRRSELYSFFHHPAAHLVPSDHRFGVPGRVDARGEVVEALAKTALEKIKAKICGMGVESIAICFLFSFLNPSQEKEAASWFQSLGIPITLSHQIVPEFREYERASTTVLNAYVAPKVSRYVDELARSIGSHHLQIMQSNGGYISCETARREPVRIILSGPAGGVVGAAKIGKQTGCERLITFDMGGTSTDVALIDGMLPMTTEGLIQEMPVKIPMIPIHTVGAGGGSIAWIDSGGILRVGPRSASAVPGPICYGQGREITVTDANLYLGFLIPDFFLGGRMRLFPERLSGPFNQSAKGLSITPHELAEGILAIANTKMERAIRMISIEKGFDPSDFVLFAFGGAGGMHAASLAKLLKIPRIMIPPNPGALSALGMLMADPIKDFSKTVMMNSETTEPEMMVSGFEEIIAMASATLKSDGLTDGKVFFDRYLDMRYQGQSHELMIPYDSNWCKRFHQIHKKTYGYCHQDAAIEVTTLRLRVWRHSPYLPLQASAKVSATIPKSAFFRRHSIYWEGRKVNIPIYHRESLLPGNRIMGPAIIVEYSSTIFLPPYGSAEVDRFNNICIVVV